MSLWTSPILSSLHSETYPPYYLDNSQAIFCADSFDVLPLFAPLSVDVTITDIPYSISQKSNGYKGKELHFGKWDVFTPGQVRRAINQICRVTKYSAYVCCSAEQVSLILKLFRRSEFQVRQLTWFKPNAFSMNTDRTYKWSTENAVFARRSKAPFFASNKHNLFTHNYPASKEHPTQKSFNLISEWVQDSCEQGAIILDPFMGSGVTLDAARMNGCRAIGIDAQSEFCRVAARKATQKSLF